MEFCRLGHLNRNSENIMPLKMFKESSPKPHKPSPGKIAHIIAVAAGKGGVGKSSVTTNLAFSLKRAGYSVGVLDADVYGPSIRRMLPEDERPSQEGDILRPAISKGIRMMSMAYFRREADAAAIRAPIANGLISQFLNKVEWGYLDFLLIDFPPGTGDIQLTLSQQANLTGALMVTTPQEVAVMDVRKAMNLFDQLHVPVIGVVENMSYYLDPVTNQKIHLFGKGGGERLAAETAVPFLGEIPIDPNVSRAGDEGQSIFEMAPLSPSIKAFSELTEALVVHATSLRRELEGCMNSFELIWKEM